jgi:DnaA-homolog protein
MPLGVQLDVALRFETFQEGANAEAVATLSGLAGGGARIPVWIFGPPGSGKSHLLQAACALAGSRGRTAAYLPLATTRLEDPAVLDGFERLDFVALDDVDAVAGDAAWERALFRLYNGLAEQGGGLAAAATGAPSSLGIGLQDLSSRLGAAVAHRLRPLAEDELGDALRRRAAHRGLELPEETLAYLKRRAPRDFAALCRLLDALDIESLVAQRRLTVPFVRDWLARGDE